jgi:hypothetical protein
MANRSAWVGGNLNSGNIAYQLAFAGTEIAGLAAGSTVMSTTQFDNTTSLDEFMDISVSVTISSGFTLSAGGGISFWMAVLQGDNSSYGEGGTRLTAGVSSSIYTPPYPALGGVQFQSTTVSTMTNFTGDIGGIVLRPVKFALIMQNNMTASSPGNPTINSGNVWIRTYNQNLNA